MSVDFIMKNWENWLKTPKGQEYKKLEEETHDFKLPKLIPIPEGWDIIDEDVKGAFYVYYNEDSETEITIETFSDTPLWAGGFPDNFHVSVKVKNVNTDHEETHKFYFKDGGWEKAVKGAMDRLRKEME